MYRKAKMPAPAEPQEIKQIIRTYPMITLTVDELAEELHISRPTAYELVKRRGFPAFHIGNRILVSRKGLQNWIDLQCETETA